MSNKSVGYVAANGSSIKNYGEKKIVGLTESGDGLSMEIQCADAKNVLGSVRKMNMGGNARRCWTGREATRRTKRRVRRQE